MTSSPVSDAIVLTIEPTLSPKRLPAKEVPSETRESVLVLSENRPAMFPRRPESILEPPSVFSRLSAPSGVEPCFDKLPSSAGIIYPKADFVVLSGSPKIIPGLFSDLAAQGFGQQL